MATKDKFEDLGTEVFGNPVTLGRLAVPPAIIVVWEILSLGLGVDTLPGPMETLAVINQGIVEGWMIPNLMNTLVTIIIGFILASIAGFIIGVELGLHDTAHDLFEPFILNTYAIPKIVLFPLFIFVFKLGIDQKVAFGAFHGFFPMLIITMSAVREIPSTYLNVGRSLGLTRRQQARYIIFPSLLIHLIVGLRLAFSLTFLGVILSELFAAKSGIGLQLRHAMTTHTTGKIMAIVTVLMVIAFIVNLAFYGVQQLLEKQWNLTAEDTV